MNRYWILPLFLLLASCAQLQVPSGETFDRIDRELKEAAASKAKSHKNDALNNAMLPPLQIESPKQVAAAEPRFDLAVTGAPAAQVFAALVSGTKYSMLIPPEVTGSITINLKSITVREALEAIREMYGFEFSFKGNRIFIQPNTMQTRMFQINYLASQRQGRSDVRVTSSSAALSSSSPGVSGGQTTGSSTGAPSPGTGTGGTTSSGTESSRISTQTNSDFWRDLNTTLSALVGTADGRAVIVNAHSGVLLVKAMPSEIRQVENYLKATRLIVERQVMLEAKIVEVQLSEGAQSGINWASFGGNSKKWAVGNVLPGTNLGATGNLTSSSATITPGAALGSIAAAGRGFFGLAFQAKDFAALLSFLETQGNVQVLSSPRVATINNQKAVLKVGTDDYFVTSVTLGTSTNTVGGTNTPPSVTLQPFFSGVALDVMPQIDEDNNIILHIHPTVSKVTEKTKVLSLGSGEYSNVTLPLASSEVSETDSIVRVQDGNIVAIGGLMSQEQRRDSSGLPVVSRAPGFLGALFGEKSASFSKRELVILIKPTVIQGENSWRQDLMETQIRVQSLDPRKQPQ
ncbi:MAG: mshL [Proteobacteria bacterium]|nr:mshL [Pseudomonadota bacterium]